MKSYITLAQERMGMIDAAEQEKDECLSRMDEIQHAIDNPVENNDNNKTYEGKRKHLKFLQTFKKWWLAERRQLFLQTQKGPNI